MMLSRATSYPRNRTGSHAWLTRLNRPPTTVPFPRTRRAASRRRRMNMVDGCVSKWLCLPAVILLMVSSCGDDQRADPTDSTSRRLTSGSLPGGTKFSVGIDTPADGARVPATPLRVEGTAEIGKPDAVRTALAFAIDASNATIGEDIDCGGDQNGDGMQNTVLDCEILALRRISGQIQAQLTVSEVGVGPFAVNTQRADVDPTAGETFLAPPFDDNDGNGDTDIVDVLRSITPGMVAKFTSHSFTATATSYGAGVTQAGKILNLSGAQRKIIVLIAGSENNHEPSIDTEIPNLSDGIVVHTVALGPNARCDSAGTGGFGSLQQIADRTGGTCVNVGGTADFDRLPVIGAAPEPVARLTALDLTVDGNPAAILSIAPPLPRFGQAHVDWMTFIPPPAPGSHEICITVTGEDPGGSGQLTDCVTVSVNAPPVARCRDVVAVADGACRASASIDDGSFDPDGGSLMCTQVPPGPFGPGPTPAVLTCSDPQGAPASCVGRVTVVDQTPPAVTCPPSQVAECVNGGAAGTYPNAQATDNCGSAAVACAPPSGSSFGLGTTPVMCTATDTSGNQSSCA